MSFGQLAPQKSNKRKTDRVPGKISATILLITGEKLSCRVENFSKTGALLGVSTILGIPDEFYLMAAAGPKRRVQVVRRSNGRLGVRFI